MKAQLTGKKYIAGMSTIEILIAFAVLMLSISAVIMVTFSNQSLVTDSQISNESISKAQAILEKARADSRLDFNLVNPYTKTETAPYLSDKLDVETNATDPTLDLWTKRITSTISWQTGGRTLSTILTTLLTNPYGEDTCSSVLTSASGWKNPAYYTFPSVDFSGPNSNGFQISDLDVYNKKLYVAASDSPNPNPENFFILSLPDDVTTNPTVLGSLDNNGSSLTGINAVKVSGNYAYVANAYGANFTSCTVASNCAQLQVIDISNSASPQVVKNIKVPGVTGSGNQAIGTSIFYYKGYVYIGLAKTASGPEFNVFDVGGGGTGASPTNPIWKGGYSVGNGVNSIFVKNNYAYIATPNSENMTIIDINTTSANFMQRVGGSNGLTTGSTNGETVYVVGNNVYLGRTFGSNEFYIFNASTPSSVSVTASKDVGTGNQTSVNGLLVRDYLAFLITESQFQVWDISNTSSIQPWTSDGSANSFLAMSILGGSGTATNCEGDRIYVAVESSQGNNKDILAVITPGIPSVYTLSNSGDITLTQGASGNTTISKVQTSGTASSNTLTASGLPTGATATFTNNPCTPNCSSIITITTSLTTTPTGTYPIIITGTGGVTTTFNLIVNAGFDYTITNPSVLNLTKGGPAVNFTATVTMTSITTPQLVTLTPPNPKPSQITITPTVGSCTPSSSTPYTCTVTFSYKASNGSTNSYTNQKITGSPNSRNGTAFTLNIN